MKKMTGLVLATALAVSVFAGTDTNTVGSENLFGSLKIDTTSPITYVAVPFEEFGDSSLAICATNLVVASNLEVDDELWAYNAVLEDYNAFLVDNGAWTHNDDYDEVGTSAVGTGVFVVRDEEPTPFSIYIFGQVPVFYDTETELPEGESLISAPSIYGMYPVDLNTLTWTGVKPAQGRMLSGNRVRGFNTAGADRITLWDADGNIWHYYYLDGVGWGRLSGANWISNATISAGTAFWYIRAEGAGTAKVEWN